MTVEELIVKLEEFEPYLEVMYVVDAFKDDDRPIKRVYKQEGKVFLDR